MADSLFDPSRPHIARVYDYLLGGKDNFAADREIGERIIAAVPGVQLGVRAQREVLGRAVQYLVADAGVRQLIDIGSGLPTAENVHEIAQRHDPATRVVYVDNDPLVLAHARTLLAWNDATIAVSGDLREPAGIMSDARLRAHLDWERPVGMLLCGILHYIMDSENPRELTAVLYDALPVGSYVFIHHLLGSADAAAAEAQAVMQAGLERGQFRTWEQIRSFFHGLEFVDPGLVLVPDWRPNPSTLRAGDHPVLRLACAGLARKP
ncbi:MAG: SAM-dependent methyltransferase [Streptosporangiaceae bacterium]